MPVGIVVAEANRNDMKLVGPTLDAIPIEAPTRPAHRRPNLCLDKGYDFAVVDELVHDYGYTAHIRRRGEEAWAKKHIPGYRARRWVVERTHSWINRWRRLLIRWEKKAANYLGLLHLACGWITYRAAHVFG